MARISAFTVFVFVTLITYTILSGAMYSVVAGTTYENPYGGTVTDWGLARNYAFSGIQNITKDGGWMNYSTAFEPDREVRWVTWLFGNQFEFKRKGINWWDSWLWYTMSGSPKTPTQVINDWDEDTNYTFYIFDQGGQFQTDAYIYPRWADANMTSFLYYPMSNSIGNNTVTIVLACNATYPSYNIGVLFGVLTGFYLYGAPAEIAIIIAGIWWILCLLAIVKLAVD